MYSTKILGGSGSQVTNQSTAKAQMIAAVKSKKAFVQTATKP
jgi:hypothetical protein